jgi:hypothetical protein
MRSYQEDSFASVGWRADHRQSWREVQRLPPTRCAYALVTGWRSAASALDPHNRRLAGELAGRAMAGICSAPAQQQGLLRVLVTWLDASYRTAIADLLTCSG